MEDLTKAGIQAPQDVGKWLCDQVRNELHMTDAAIQLGAYLEDSCNTTLKNIE